MTTSSQLPGYSPPLTAFPITPRIADISFTYILRTPFSLFLAAHKQTDSRSTFHLMSLPSIIRAEGKWRKVMRRGSI